jgi:hypothetical protein
MLHSSLVLLAVVGLAAGYKWPSPQLEKLDQLRYEQSGVNGHVAGFVQPCSAFNFDFDSTRAGRTNAADWLRTVSYLNSYNI